MNIIMNFIHIAENVLLRSVRTATFCGSSSGGGNSGHLQSDKEKERQKAGEQLLFGGNEPQYVFRLACRDNA